MSESNKTASSDSKVTEKMTESKIGTSTVSATQSKNKESIECLHEAKPGQNISINATIQEKDEPKDSSESLTSTKSNKGPQKIETVFEKLSVVSEQSEPSTNSLVPPELQTKKSDKKDKKPSATEINNPMDRKNSNDSWRISGSSGKLNKQRDLASSIFPAGCMGCKDNSQESMSPRRFLDAKEASQDFAGHIDATPRKRPSSAKPQNSRNPLTGDGIEDDVRRCSSRKKGN